MMPTSTVHVYALVRAKVPGLEALRQPAAIPYALETLDLYEVFGRQRPAPGVDSTEWGEELACFLARLWETPWTTGDLRLFSATTDEGTRVAATIRVTFPADACAVELTYDEARFATPAPPLLLVAAAVAGIYGLWGGPPHFVRFASRLLAIQAGRLSSS